MKIPVYKDEFFMLNNAAQNNQGRLYPCPMAFQTQRRVERSLIEKGFAEIKGIVPVITEKGRRCLKEVIPVEAKAPDQAKS